MDEETKFKDAVLRAAKSHLEFYVENLGLKKAGLEIELTDISIDRQSIEIVDDEIIDKLIPVTKCDIKPDAQLCVEPIINVMGRNVIAPIILNIVKECNIELEDSKAEITTLLSEDEENFKVRWPNIQRIIESLIVILIVAAIKFGIRFAIELLK